MAASERLPVPATYHDYVLDADRVGQHVRLNRPLIYCMVEDPEGQQKLDYQPVKLDSRVVPDLGQHAFKESRDLGQR